MHELLYTLLNLNEKNVYPFNYLSLLHSFQVINKDTSAGLKTKKMKVNKNTVVFN